MNTLIRKYNVPGPRYTSYPTVPYWDKKGINSEEWKQTFVQSFEETNQSQGISLYIHLPFCETLCTFCGCNKRITKNHRVEDPYIEAILKEWDLYISQFSQKPIIKEIHLGGGTPTFFPPKKLRGLIEGLFEKADRAEKVSFSFEGHPNNTNSIHLEVLYNLGFRRVSYGVQDYDPIVQKTINRIQPFGNVKRATETARKLGYDSISHDLIFGLPHQKMESIIDTIEKTNLLRPDRISFYSYAHVPWIKGTGQRGYSEEDLPTGEEKRMLYEEGKRMLEASGYHEIGMDHFALKEDEMYTARNNHKLHRNFMGYSSSKTQLMIGLGASAISDSWYSFGQNERKVEDYYKRLQENEIPTFKGHLLTPEDLIIRKHILNLMCNFETTWDNEQMQFQEMEQVKESLIEMEQDSLLIFTPNGVKITEKGKPFVRNICMAFDLRLKRNIPETQLFSMTV